MKVNIINNLKNEKHEKDALEYTSTIINVYDCSGPESDNKGERGLKD